MAHPLEKVVQHIRRVAAGQGATDGELLQSFVTSNDQSAFAALAKRHGPLVFAVCKRVIGNVEDAEDAFQAAFVVLARNAAKVPRRCSLSTWLHGVAFKIALNARRLLARRRRHERQAKTMVSNKPASDATWREIQVLMDEEIHKLPERYRDPFILCCLEGQSYAAAGQRLGLKESTVHGRLTEARKRLQARLSQRGVELTAVLGAAALAPGAATAQVAPALVAKAVSAATSAAVPPSVMALVKGLTVSLAIKKAKVGIALFVVFSAMVGTTSTWAVQQGGREKAPRAPRKQEAAVKTEPAVAKDMYGDPLPAGVLARLGTLKLRAAYARTALSRDGKTIIACDGMHVKYWNAGDGTLREQRELPTGFFRSVIGGGSYLSADGRILAVTNYDAPIDLWDVGSAQRVDRRFLPGKEFLDASLSPDGKMIAVLSRENFGKRLVRLWDVGLGERLTFDMDRSLNLRRCVAFSSDGKLLAVTDGAWVVCWNTDERRQVWRGNAKVETLAFTPDGQTLIGASYLQTVSWHAWIARTGEEDTSRKLPKGRGCVELAVSPDNATLAFCRYATIEGVDPGVRIWDMHTGSLVRSLPSNGGIVTFAPDGKSLYTNDGALQRWELATGRPMLPDTYQAGHRNEVFRVVYSRDGRLLASSAEDGTIRIWDTETAKTLRFMRTTRAYDHTNLAFTSDAAQLISGDTDGDLHVWDTTTGNELRRINLSDGELGGKEQHVHRLHLMPDDRTAVVLGWEPESPKKLGETVSTWDLATGKRITSADVIASETYYTAFAPDGNTFASQGEIFETATGNSRVKLEGATRRMGYHHAISPDGRLVVGLITYPSQDDPTKFSTKVDGTRIWSAATGKELLRLPTDWICRYAFTPDARYLATADMEGVQLWELLTGNVVLKHKAHDDGRGSYGASFASCMAMAPDGRSLATGHPDSTILIWRLTPPAVPLNVAILPRLFKDLAGSDAAKAYDASWRMTHTPDLVLPYLTKHVEPAKATPAQQTARLLTDLDSPVFIKREESIRQLRVLGDRAAVAMRQALKSNPSLEMRLRLEKLLDELKTAPSGETLGALRAVTVLERIGTEEARKLLTLLAEGDAEARLTQEAHLSLQRLIATRPEGKGRN